MLKRRATEIVTAGLVLAGGDLALAQGVPARPPAPSPYNGLPNPAPAEPAPAASAPVVYEAAGSHTVGLSSGHSGIFHFGWSADPGPGMPLGEAIGMHFKTHVANGAAARMTLYDFDFVCGKAELNYRGRERLFAIAAKLAHAPFPVVIEQLPLSPELAISRRTAILNELAAAGIRVPSERIVVGTPLAVPLRGVEAELIYQTLMNQTGSAGLQPGSASTGGSRTVTATGAGAGAGTMPPTGR